mmetsp:Transcript_5401/g.20565  ORF Transcript_5401/g.20565 Transcript_5401/m.20565 type:complete len:523 (-) Transcript_5401:50-1618(-)
MGPGTQGYGTELGAATAPIQTVIVSECPGSLTLDAGPFVATIGLEDSMSNRVVGTILEDNHIYAQVSLTGDSQCSLVGAGDDGTQTATVDVLTGSATFFLELKGRQKSDCLLQFSFKSDMFLPVATKSCAVVLTNCTDPTMSVVSNDSFDTCAVVETSITAGTVALLIVVCILLVTVCLVYGVIFVKYWQRRTRKARTTVANLEFEDILELGWTVKNLLEDPSITVISFDNLHFYDRIGVGAAGIVSSAELFMEYPEEADKDGIVDRSTSMKVAVKELRLPTSQMEEVNLRSFLTEIQLLNALSHENIVQFMGVAYDHVNDTLCLVTELMDQGSLADLIRRKGDNLSQALKLKMAADAAAGMKYLHDNNVIHRDLKTQNLLVNNSWQCKISDFGISTVKSRTMTMTCIGTPLYMAPEVLQNSRYSEKADVFSFGIVLVELYTGRPAYHSLSEEGASDAQLMYKIVAEGLRPDLSDMPHALQELVADCLCQEAAMRPSFDELHRRLKRLQRKLEPGNTAFAYL